MEVLAHGCGVFLWTVFAKEILKLDLKYKGVFCAMADYFLSLVVHGVEFAFNRNEKHAGKEYRETKLKAYL
jgi:hypothetical protein